MRRALFPLGAAMAVAVLSTGVAFAQDASPSAAPSTAPSAAATGAAPSAAASVAPSGAAPSAAATAAAEPTPTPEPTPPPEASGILKRVQDRGTLICGVSGALPGFSVLDEATGQYSGFDADYCRAVAAAVLGDPTKVEFRQLTAPQRGPALQTGEIDVLIRNTTWTSSRDASWGLFAPTTFYDGQGIMVRADSGVATLEDLATATICVQSGTTTEQNLTDQMSARGIAFTPLVFADPPTTYAAYNEGRCDAVTSDLSQLSAQKTTLSDPAAHALLDVVLSKEPLGPATPLGDDQWFNVVKWTVFATIAAEELGLTQASIATADTSDPVISRLVGATGGLASYLALSDGWIVDVISAVGNYGEIYDRNLGPNTPFNIPRGLNSLWTNGGLLYSPPYR